MRLRSRLVEVDEIDRLEPAWNGLLARSRFDDVFESPAYARAWRHTLGVESKPHVLIVEDRGEVRLIASLSSRRDDPAVWTTAGARRADYANVVHAAGDLHAVRAFVDGLTQHRWGADHLVLRNVPGGADLLTVFPLAVTTGGARERLPALLDRPLVTRHTKQEHPGIDRAGLEAQRHRLSTSKNSAYQMRLLGRTGPVTYCTTTDPAIVRAALPAFFELHRVSSTAQGRSSPFECVAEQEFVVALLDELAPLRALRLDLLHAGDEMVAAHLGFEWNERVLWYKPCFDPEHAKASPGKLLLLHAMADAHDRGFEELDLLNGTEAYKARYATHVRETGGLDIFRTRRAWLRGRSTT